MLNFKKGILEYRCSEELLQMRDRCSGKFFLESYFEQESCWKIVLPKQDLVKTS